MTADYRAEKAAWETQTLGPVEKKEAPRPRIGVLSGHADAAPLYGPDALEDVSFEPIDGSIQARIDGAYQSKYRDSPYLAPMISLRRSAPYSRSRACCSTSCSS